MIVPLRISSEIAQSRRKYLSEEERNHEKANSRHR